MRLTLKAAGRWVGLWWWWDTCLAKRETWRGDPAIAAAVLRRLLEHTYLPGRYTVTLTLADWCCSWGGKKLSKSSPNGHPNAALLAAPPKGAEPINLQGPSAWCNPLALPAPMLTTQP